MKKHKNGFTLAEVLITLVIIGIIAAMTIPTLMNKTNEQETVVAVKKAYSTLSQAYQRMIAENGEIYPETLGSTEAEVTKSFGEIMLPYLNIQKNCGQETGGDCWSTKNGGMYKKFDGSDWTNINNNASWVDYRLLLVNGMSLTLLANPYYQNCGTNDALQNVLGWSLVDINGDKAPNTAGKDVFGFYFSKYGVIPIGTPDDTRYPATDMKSNGRSATAWVVTKGNMDYLRKDVSW